jgi:DNA-binding CsgD family transcriptional regulator
MTASLGTADRVVNLFFHHERPTGRHFGTRGRSLARMLYPAFRAGVHATHTIFLRRHRLAHLADAMTAGIALADGTGRVVHRNPALVALLAGEAQRAAIEATLLLAARECVLLLRGSVGADVADATLRSRRLRRRFSTGAGHYTVTATALDREPSAYGVAVAVIVERADVAVFPAALLVKRYHLTPRELDVARLLNGGESNGEIARILGMSAATARHHTESVMRKLSVSSRARIPARLATLGGV